ncbi:MAG: PASTA domain-containing protein [Clostridia bacterium]|nr:PASTA domain-containing protein [Clostridia bacterium]
MKELFQKLTRDIYKNRVKRRTDKSFIKRATSAMCCLVALILIFNLGSIGSIMIFKGEEYSEIAADNQLSDTVLDPIRGTIYDRNMTPLAVSTAAWILSVNPSEIKKKFSSRPEHLEDFYEYLATNLSKILSVDKAETMEKLKKEGSLYQVIKKNVSGSERIAMQEFFAEKYVYEYQATERKFFFFESVVTKKGKVNAANFFDYESNSNREYAKGNFASTVIGVVNADNKGETGIEAYYDEELQGESGRILTATDVAGRVLDTSYEAYYDAVEGNGVVLTIDFEIQSYLENALNQAYDSLDCDGVYGIVMDVDTGAILALSDKPDFDLNNPRVLDDNVNTDTLKEFEKGTVEYSTEYSRLLYDQWSSFCVTNNYEPGSSFKIFCAAAALEEDIVDNIDSKIYNCTSHTSVADITYHCANYKAHGSQSLTQGLMNSCNTFFITLGQKLGIEKYYKYFEAFGFTERTGIDLANEAYSVVHKKDKMSKVDLASTSFGQGFRISPIQLITATCAIANGGDLMVPYLVGSIVDSEGNIINETEPTVKRKVISEDTAEKVAQMMTAVVDDGTGRNAKINGYAVAGKTASAQKLDDNADREVYVASFVCFAPADDPEVAILVGVDNTHDGYRSGGAVAAPIAKQVMEPTLEYLSVERKYTAEELSKISKSTPDLIGKTVSAAKSLASNQGLKVKIVGEGDTVISQMPAATQTIPQGGVIVLYTEKDSGSAKTKVPDFTGLTVSQVNSLAGEYCLNIVFSGPTNEAGVKAYAQSVAKGAKVDMGSSVTVTFKSDNIIMD